jgi:hypothetical protein
LIKINDSKFQPLIVLMVYGFEETFNMKRFDINVGPNDAFLRIFAGLILLAFVLIGLEIAWAWIGVALILTGSARRCPAYLLAGISTRGK